MFRNRYSRRMRLYHGSDRIVDRPRILEPRHSTDFGRGFYTTESQEQAEKWALKMRDRRGSESAYVSIYDYDEGDDLKILVFDGPTEDWLDFVHSNRIQAIDHDYDVIIGPIADDGVLMTLFKYDNNMLTKEQAIEELKAGKYQGQVLFHTDKSLDSIHYIGYREVE